MIILCEKCQVSFNIDEKLIKKDGSKVRCSKCKHVFKVFPPDPTKPPAPKEEPDVFAKVTEKPSGEKYESEGTITIVDFSQDAFETIEGEEVKEKYETLRTIGSGGMGEVLLAKDTQLLRKVAIKLLKKDVTSPAALSFFLREAQVTAQLDHPNIVPLYTVKQPESEDENVSFVMKLIKGKDLSEIIIMARDHYNESPKAVLPPELNLRTRLEHFLKACDGITYAHRKQVVHRDLKPANIMVGDFGEVYVMDWGIAKMLKDEVDFTTQGTEIFTGDLAGAKTSEPGSKSGQIVGTLSYMSPEQATGAPDVGIASDIFSLGAVLYELVTLRPARVGDAKKKLKWAEGGYLNDMIHMVPDKKIDPELKAIIHKATALDEEDRYLSVGAFAEDVRCYLRGDEVSELPDNLPRKMWRWMIKHRQQTIIIMLTVFLLLSGLSIFSLYREQANLKAARLRESRFSQLQALVSAQAHVIDSNFLRLEDLAANLANNAIYLAQDAPPNNEKFYWMAEFKDPKKAPPDHNHSTLYNRPVSIDYPVVKLAPGVLVSDVKGLMQKLAPLRHHFKQTLIDSQAGFTPKSESEARNMLTNIGVPIRWAFIGLQKGVMYSYPGKGTYSDAYDPRVRPWYKLGAGKRTVQWGNPYADIQGLGLVLPCAISLFDREADFLGVLGMDITFSDLIRDNLTRSKAREVIESYLLDDMGQIVVSSSLLGKEVKQYKMTNAGLELDLFPVPEIVESIKNKESGLVNMKEDGRPTVIVYYRMESLGWYYVEKVDTRIILE